MLLNFDYFLLIYIFEFINKNELCILSIKDKFTYFSLKYSCTYFYSLLKKECNLFFIYNPLNSNLKTLCECHKHCNKDKNNIYIINLLNSKKIQNNSFLGKIEFDTSKDCIKICPYFKELNYKLTKIDNLLYLSGEHEKTFSFI